jgi:translation initiation factor 3 subunit K
MSSDKPSREAVEAMLAKSPYSASNQAVLEAYVDAQAKGECPYYMDANRSLLRLYQCFPQSENASKVALILLLALLEYPSTDLLALSFLVPERLQKEEPCATILKCANLLESCSFTEFWQVFGGMEGDDQIKSVLAGPVSGTERLQRAIVQVLALTYRTSSLDKVLAALNMSSGDAISKLNHACVESVSGDTVVFAATADNTKRNRVFQEGVNFGAIASMMAKVSTE